MTFTRAFWVAAASIAIASPTFAQSATKSVTVSANLTSVCRFANSTGLGITVGYTAFQTTDASNTGTAAVECTRSATTPTLSFDSTIGVVAGLTYTVASSYSQTAAGADPAGSSATDLGTPRTGTVTVTATIPAGQAGSGASGTTAAAAKVLTVTF